MEELIRRIQEKLQQVLKQAVALRKENEKLRNELHEIKSGTGQRDELIQILELRIEVLKASKSNMPAEDKKQLEKRRKLFR